MPNPQHKHVFGRRKETREPGGNLHGQTVNLKRLHTDTVLRIKLRLHIYFVKYKASDWITTTFWACRCVIGRRRAELRMRVGNNQPRL